MSRPLPRYPIIETEKNILDEDDDDNDDAPNELSTRLGRSPL